MPEAAIKAALKAEARNLRMRSLREWMEKIPEPWNRSRTGLMTAQELEKMQELARREATLILSQAPRSGKAHFSRGPNLAISRERQDLLKVLTTELTAIYQAVQTNVSLAELRSKFPKFRIWDLLSDREQSDLLNAEFKPRAMAKSIVMREYGITSEETLKKDRQKLRRFGK